MTLARGDLERAIALDPRALAPHVVLARNGKSTGHSDADFERAIRAFPLSFNIYQQRLVQLTPRWGGSYEAMRALVERAAAHAGENPRLRRLAGFVDWARAQDRSTKRDFAAALRELTRARAHGEHWVFFDALGDAKLSLGDARGALDDFDAALALRPEFDAAWRGRALAQAKLEQYEAAADSFLSALAINPSAGLDDAGYYAKIALEAGALHQASGRPREALSAYAEALLIEPGNAEAQKRRAAILRQGDPSANSAEIVALIERAEREDTLAAYRALDVTLSRRGRYAEIVQHWKAYLGRHPNDGEALLERAGTYTHVRQPQAAVADAEKACALGVGAACAQAKRIRERLESLRQAATNQTE